MRSRRFFGVCIILSLIILVFSSLPAKAEFKIYDANDQFLGIFLNAGGPLMLYNPSMDRLVVFDEDESSNPIGQYQDIQVFDTVYYAEDGCQGYPYVYGGDHCAKVTGKIPCNDKYYSTNTNFPAVFMFKSRRYKSNCGCDDTNGTFDTFYLRLELVTLPFSTPIKVPYRFEHVDPAVTPKAKVVVIPMGD